MKTRKLGKTGLDVSEIGFGGEWLERHPEEEGIELIKYTSSKGINILDCWMADPKSRDIIGKGIKDNRSDWFIQGHIGSTWKDEQYFRTRDMKYVRPAFEDLLKRLQTDYIDLYYQHRIDPKVEPEVVAGVMKELIAAGKIKAWGISETTEEYLRRAHAVCPVTAIQNRYSMMARWYEDLFVVCKELGITYVAFSPMANGLLSGKFTPDSTFEKGDFRNNMPQYQKEGYEKAKKLLNLLKVLSEKKNCTMAQLSIAWMLRKNDFIVPIPGSRKLERLEENFRAGEIEVTIDEIKEIDALLDTIDFDVFGGH